MSLKATGLLEFGPYRIDAAERTLWRDGKRVPLTPKAMETLLVLATNGGRLVEKEDLLKAVWPDTFVEEGSLAFQVSLLRKTLGEGFIETVPRRGYRFTEPVRHVEPEAPPAERTVEIPPEGAVVAPPQVGSRRRILLMAATGVGG